MRSIINIATSVLLLFSIVGGLEILDATLINSPVREMTPESENTQEEVVHFFHSDQRTSKKEHSYNLRVADKPILLPPSSYVYQPAAPKKERYILHQALLI